MGWLSYKGGDNLYPVEQGLFCSRRIMPHCYSYSYFTPTTISWDGIPLDFIWANYTGPTRPHQPRDDVLCGIGMAHYRIFNTSWWGGFRHEFRVVPDILALFHSELPISKGALIHI